MVNKLLYDAAKKLSNSETPMLDARVLLSYAAGVGNSALIFDMPDSASLDRFKEYIKMRQQGVPVHYIVGEREFMGLNFIINTSTLIPRPDTERLVELVIEKNCTTAPLILDLCTGSGCIGISLASFISDSTVHLADISKEALSIADKNIARHSLKSRVSSFQIDILNDEIKGNYDIIVSNPPYIETDVLSTLEVSKTEPLLALDGGCDGLDFYRAIALKSVSALKKGGMLALEIGYNQAESVANLLKDSFNQIEIFKDYGGNDRVVIAYL